jgi:hypothetical protein
MNIKIKKNTYHFFLVIINKNSVDVTTFKEDYIQAFSKYIRAKMTFGSSASAERAAPFRILSF